MQAAQLGADVVLIEKLGSLGGSTGHASGVLITTSEGDDTFTAQDFYEFHLKRSNSDPAIAKRIANEAASNVKWLREMDIPLNEARNQYMDWNITTVSPDAKGGVIRPNGMKIINGLEKTALSSGKVDLHLNTRAYKIVLENDEIKGIEAERKDGSKLTVYAKAVILASGGFDNGEMVLQFEPNALKMLHVSGVGNEGDGILMAEAIGADTIYPEGRKVSGNAMGMNKYGLPSNYMMINGLGNRLVDESAHYSYEYNAIMDSPSPDIYRLYDSNNDLTMLEENVKKGIVIKAETIEELAKAINVDVNNLNKTINKYNESKGKTDEDFGKDASLMLGFEQAPFYAIRVLPEILLSFGGLRINENAQVLDKNGNAIPMLYAAGEIANGNYFYTNYSYSGGAIQHAIATGRIAARDAVEKLK